MHISKEKDTYIIDDINRYQTQLCILGPLTGFRVIVNKISHSTTLYKNNYIYNRYNIHVHIVLCIQNMHNLYKARKKISDCNDYNCILFCSTWMPELDIRSLVLREILRLSCNRNRLEVIINDT